VSAESARDDYGAVLTGEGDDLHVDEDATAQRRQELAAGRGDFPLIDRGPGYEALAHREE
jgi:N-methylhydantoinase B